MTGLHCSRLTQLPTHILVRVAKLIPNYSMEVSESRIRELEQQDAATIPRENFGHTCRAAYSAAARAEGVEVWRLPRWTSTVYRSVPSGAVMYHKDLKFAW